MSSSIAIAVGGSLISGAMNAGAASDAANTQAGAARDSAALQAQTTREQLAQQKLMYDQNVQRLNPWVGTGTNANNQLGMLMGIAPQYTQIGGTGTALTPEEKAAQDAEYKAYTSNPEFGSLTKNFGSGDLGLDPSYQFRLQQGMQGLQASAAARGGLLTGQGAKDIADYNQGAASTEYQAAYNRYVGNQTNLYNRLTGISNSGENAAAQVGNAGTQVSANMANTAMAGTAAQNQWSNYGASAQASGILGANNAWSSALSGGMKNYQANKAAGGSSGGATTTNWDTSNSYAGTPYNADTTIPMQEGGGY